MELGKDKSEALGLDKDKVGVMELDNDKGEALGLDRDKGEVIAQVSVKRQVIGIMGAVQEETRLIHTLINVVKESLIAGRLYTCGTVNGHDVVLTNASIGKVAAASATTTMIQTFGCTEILFIGTAGAVDASLNVGDFVISDKLIQHDMDCSAGGGKIFEIPKLGKSYFHSDEKNVDDAVKAAKKYIDEIFPAEIKPELLESVFMIGKPKVYTGTIASGDKFIANPAETARLSELIDNLQCVEMESAAAAQVCFENDIQILVARVVSDKADHSASIDFNKFVDEIAGHMLMGFVAEYFSA